MNTHTIGATSTFNTQRNGYNRKAVKELTEKALTHCDSFIDNAQESQRILGRIEEDLDNVQKELCEKEASLSQELQLLKQEERILNKSARILTHWGNRIKGTFVSAMVSVAAGVTSVLIWNKRQTQNTHDTINTKMDTAS